MSAWVKQSDAYLGCCCPTHKHTHLQYDNMHTYKNRHRQHTNQKVKTHKMHKITWKQIMFVFRFQFCSTALVHATLSVI